MRAGKLRHQITIEQRQAGEDAEGQPVDTWLPVITVWARIKTLQGRELIAAQAIQAEATMQIEIRYLASLAGLAAAALRVKYGARTLDIKGPPQDVDEMHREIRMLAAEGLTQG